MPRKASVRWSKTANAWRSDVGPVGKNGRRKPEYFREIPNTPKGKREAERKLEDHLRRRDHAEAQATEDASNPRVWPGVVKPFLDAVWALVEAGKKSDETYRTHRERLVTWCRWAASGKPKIAERLARSLTDEDAAEWIAWLGREGKRLPKGRRGPVSATRINGLMTSVNACLNWAARRIPDRAPKVILPHGNPFASVRVGAASRRVVRVSTRAEVARFLRAARKEVEAWTRGASAGQALAGRGRAAGGLHALWAEAPVLHPGHGAGGLTAGQAGAIGGTSGAVVRRVYMQEDIAAMFEGPRRCGPPEGDPNAPETPPPRAEWSGGG